jgi:hypothetical protein
MKSAPPERTDAVVRAHLRPAWWALLVVLSLGIVLEALHGLKAGAYVRPAAETRRLLWTLAHAHGTLLALVQVAFALSLPSVPGLMGDAGKLVGRLLRSATLLIPGGFFLGGTWIHAGDPGVGIVLVPVGALLLVVAVARVAVACATPAPATGGTPR